MDFTVITVSYNAESNIEETIKSVLEQINYSFVYEYIIIDGKSTDNTLQIAQKYKCAFKEKGINYKIYSEKDKGIYDAMNKGVKFAKGRYIFFLNCGDTFTDKNIFLNLQRFMLGANEADILFGNVIVNNSGITKQLRFSTVFYNPLSFVLNRMICHQAIWSKKEVLEEHPFRICYKLCADREWLAYCCSEKMKCHYIDIDICKYDTNGISSSAMSLEEMRKECDEINKMYFPVLFYILRPLIVIGRKIKRSKSQSVKAGGDCH